LNVHEIVIALRAIYRGRLLAESSFREVQTIFQNLRVHESAARKLLDAFLALAYPRYVQQRLAKLKPTLNVPYAVNHIPPGTPHNRRPGKVLKAKYLTIHSTGNPGSSAKNERAWLTNATNDRTASFHIVVDQGEAIECLPLDEVAWHAGDGSGSGNMASISLEICESADRAKTLQNAAAVAAKILQDQRLGIENLRRHHDWATKVCPRILIDAQFRKAPEQTWEWFKDEVAKVY
jgi:N-acetylmuramoyl-L-alanine amidase